MMIINIYPDMDFIANALEIPMVIRLLGVPFEPAMTILSDNAPYHSSEMTIFTPILFGLDP
jgi:hypothetical protein